MYEEETTLQCSPNGMSLLLVQPPWKSLTHLAPQGEDVRVLGQEGIHILRACDRIEVACTHTMHTMRYGYTYTYICACIS